MEWLPVQEKTVQLGRSPRTGGELLGKIILICSSLHQPDGDSHVTSVLTDLLSTGKWLPRIILRALTFWSWIWCWKCRWSCYHRTLSFIYIFVTLNYNGIPIVLAIYSDPIVWDQGHSLDHFWHILEYWVEKGNKKYRVCLVWEE